MTRSGPFRLVAGVAAAVALWAMPLPAADTSPAWLTGRQFRERLTQPASVFWESSPLAECLLGFAKAQQVAVVLDRRVDPDQKLDLTAREEPVMAVFRAVAAGRNLGVTTLGDLVYLGPPASAERLRTVAELRREEIAALGSTPSRKFAKEAPLKWKDLDSPRDLLRGLAERNDLELVNPDRVPHDLWPAACLPAVPLADSLTLILHQFDLTYQVAQDARRVAIVPLPEKVAMVRDYPGGEKPESLAQRWRAAVPGCEIRVADGRVYVRGLIEDHESIEELRTGAARRLPPGTGQPAARPAEQVFTADVPNQPLGAVLEHFARQLGLQLEVDRASLEKAGVSLDQLISFHVEKASFDELFRAVLTPVGCACQRRGNVLRVWAEQTPSGGKNEKKDRR